MSIRRESTVTNEMAAAFAELRCQGGYPVILADPPWQYENWSLKGEAKSANKRYKCMSIEEICAIPVELLAARHAALFLWVTWPMMPHWMGVVRSFGFDYAGLAWEWTKYNPHTGKYAFGPGYGTRKNLEPCLLCTRGAPPLRDRIGRMFFGSEAGPVPSGVRSVRDFIEWMPLDAIRSPRREHSRKPDEQYRRIETLFEGPYIELFSRNDRPGWVHWGDEVGKFSS